MSTRGASQASGVDGTKRRRAPASASCFLCVFFLRATDPDAFCKKLDKETWNGAVRPQRGCQEQRVYIFVLIILRNCTSAALCSRGCCAVPSFRQGRSPPPESSQKKKTDACMSEQEKLHIPAQSPAPKLEQTHAITLTHEQKHASKRTCTKYVREQKIANAQKRTRKKTSTGA